MAPTSSSSSIDPSSSSYPYPYSYSPSPSRLTSSSLSHPHPSSTRSRYSSPFSNPYSISSNPIALPSFPIGGYYGGGVGYGSSGGGGGAGGTYAYAYSGSVANGVGNGNGVGAGALSGGLIGSSGSSSRSEDYYYNNNRSNDPHKLTFEHLMDQAREMQHDQLEEEEDDGKEEEREATLINPESDLNSKGNKDKGWKNKDKDKKRGRGMEMEMEMGSETDGNGIGFRTGSISRSDLSTDVMSKSGNLDSGSSSRDTSVSSGNNKGAVGSRGDANGDRNGDRNGKRNMNGIPIDHLNLNRRTGGSGEEFPIDDDDGQKPLSKKKHKKNKKKKKKKPIPINNGSSTGGGAAMGEVLDDRADDEESEEEKDHETDKNNNATPTPNRVEKDISSGGSHPVPVAIAASSSISSPPPSLSSPSTRSTSLKPNDGLTLPFDSNSSRSKEESEILGKENADIRKAKSKAKRKGKGKGDVANGNGNASISTSAPESESDPSNSSSSFHPLESSTSTSTLKARQKHILNHDIDIPASIISTPSSLTTQTQTSSTPTPTTPTPTPTRLSRSQTHLPPTSQSSVPTLSRSHSRSQPPLPLPTSSLLDSSIQPISSIRSQSQHPQPQPEKTQIPIPSAQNQMLFQNQKRYHQPFWHPQPEASGSGSEPSSASVSASGMGGSRSNGLSKSTSGSRSGTGLGSEFDDDCPGCLHREENENEQGHRKRQDGIQMGDAMGKGSGLDFKGKNDKGKGKRKLSGLSHATTVGTSSIENRQEEVAKKNETVRGDSSIGILASTSQGIGIDDRNSSQQSKTMPTKISSSTSSSPFSGSTAGTTPPDHTTLNGTDRSSLTVPFLAQSSCSNQTASSFPLPNSSTSPQSQSRSQQSLDSSPPSTPLPSWPFDQDIIYRNRSQNRNISIGSFSLNDSSSQSLGLLDSLKEKFKGSSKAEFGRTTSSVWDEDEASQDEEAETLSCFSTDNDEEEESIFSLGSPESETDGIAVEGEGEKLEGKKDSAFEFDFGELYSSILDEGDEDILEEDEEEDEDLLSLFSFSSDEEEEGEEGNEKKSAEETPPFFSKSNQAKTKNTPARFKTSAAEADGFHTSDNKSFHRQEREKLMAQSKRCTAIDRFGKPCGRRRRMVKVRRMVEVNSEEEGTHKVGKGKRRETEAGVRYGGLNNKGKGKSAVVDVEDQFGTGGSGSGHVTHQRKMVKVKKVRVRLRWCQEHWLEQGELWKGLQADLSHHPSLLVFLPYEGSDTFPNINLKLDPSVKNSHKPDRNPLYAKPRLFEPESWNPLTALPLPQPPLPLTTAMIEGIDHMGVLEEGSNSADGLGKDQEGSRGFAEELLEKMAGAKEKQRKDDEIDEARGTGGGGETFKNHGSSNHGDTKPTNPPIVTPNSTPNPQPKSYPAPLKTVQNISTSYAPKSPSSLSGSSPISSPISRTNSGGGNGYLNGSGTVYGVGGTTNGNGVDCYHTASPSRFGNLDVGFSTGFGSPSSNFGAGLNMNNISSNSISGLSRSSGGFGSLLSTAEALSGVGGYSVGGYGIMGMAMSRSRSGSGLGGSESESRRSMASSSGFEDDNQKPKGNKINETLETLLGKLKPKDGRGDRAAKAGEEVETQSGVGTKPTALNLSSGPDSRISTAPSTNTLPTSAQPSVPRAPPNPPVYLDPESLLHRWSHTGRKISNALQRLIDTQIYWERNFGRRRWEGWKKEWKERQAEKERPDGKMSDRRGGEEKGGATGKSRKDREMEHLEKKWESFMESLKLPSSTSLEDAYASFNGSGYPTNMNGVGERGAGKAKAKGKVDGLVDNENKNKNKGKGKEKAKAKDGVHGASKKEKRKINVANGRSGLTSSLHSEEDMVERKRQWRLKARRAEKSWWLVTRKYDFGNEKDLKEWKTVKQKVDQVVARIERRLYTLLITRESSTFLLSPPEPPSSLIPQHCPLPSITPPPPTPSPALIAPFDQIPNPLHSHMHATRSELLELLSLFGAHATFIEDDLKCAARIRVVEMIFRRVVSRLESGSFCVRAVEGSWGHVLRFLEAADVDYTLEPLDSLSNMIDGTAEGCPSCPVHGCPIHSNAADLPKSSSTKASEPSTAADPPQQDDSRTSRFPPSKPPAQTFTLNPLLNNADLETLWRGMRSLSWREIRDSIVDALLRDDGLFDGLDPESASSGSFSCARTDTRSVDGCHSDLDEDQERFLVLGGWVYANRYENDMGRECWEHFYDLCPCSICALGVCESFEEWVRVRRFGYIGTRKDEKGLFWDWDDPAESLACRVMRSLDVVGWREWEGADGADDRTSEEEENSPSMNGMNEYNGSVNASGKPTATELEKLASLATGIKDEKLKAGLASAMGIGTNGTYPSSSWTSTNKTSMSEVSKVAMASGKGKGSKAMWVERQERPWILLKVPTAHPKILPLIANLSRIHTLVARNLSHPSQSHLHTSDEPLWWSRIRTASSKADLRHASWKPETSIPSNSNLGPPGVNGGSGAANVKESMMDPSKVLDLITSPDKKTGKTFKDCYEILVLDGTTTGLPKHKTSLNAKPSNGFKGKSNSTSAANLSASSSSQCRSFADFEWSIANVLLEVFEVRTAQEAFAWIRRESFEEDEIDKPPMAKVAPGFGLGGETHGSGKKTGADGNKKKKGANGKGNTKPSPSPMPSSSADRTLDDSLAYRISRSLFV